MSWLARSISNSLRLDDDDDDNDRDHNPDLESDSITDTKQLRRLNQTTQTQPLHSQSQSEEIDERGSDDNELQQSSSVRDDLTELKDTLTKQIWGVASFLTVPPPPPPPPPPTNRLCADLEQSEVRIVESAEIRGESMDFGLDSVMEDEERQDGNCVVGITDEVFTFATNIAMHPETWLDFPLDPDDDLDDFEMSIGQEEHALAITQLSPRLNALRIELCPCHMSESYFWKVYFVLLHSRLNKHDAEILSSPQVMEARAMWMHELQKQTKPETDWCGRFHDNANELHEDSYSGSFSPRTYYGAEPSGSNIGVEQYETEKHLVESSDAQFVDKSVIEEKPQTKTEDRDVHVLPYSKISIPHFEDDDDDDWPEEDCDLGSYSGNIVCNDEDFSFSDLEADDDDDDIRFRIKSKTVSKET